MIPRIQPQEEEEAAGHQLITTQPRGRPRQRRRRHYDSLIKRGRHGQYCGESASSSSVRVVLLLLLLVALTASMQSSLEFGNIVVMAFVPSIGTLAPLHPLKILSSDSSSRSRSRIWKSSLLRSRFDDVERQEQTVETKDGQQLSQFHQQRQRYVPKATRSMQEKSPQSTSGLPPQLPWFFPTPNSLFPSLLLSAALALGTFPLAAHAGFGPSSGATTTPPPGLKSPQTLLQPDDLFQSSSKSGKKLSMAIGSTLDERRLAEFSSQLDVIIETLRNRGDSVNANNNKMNIDDNGVIAPMTREQEAIVDELVQKQKEQLEKAELLQSQIQDRERLLERLERQPYWFNYMAAFLGSVASTLVMHPIDTLKVRMQVQKAQQANMSEEELAAYEAARNSTDDSSSTSLLATLTMNETLAIVNDVDSGHGTNNNNDRHRHDAAATSLDSTDVASQASAGIASLYEGLTGNLLKEGPPSAVYLGVYETVKYALAPKVSAAYLLLVYLVAGAAGELVGSVIRAPAEAIKSLVQSKQAESAIQASQRVFGTAEGRENVFRAWQASVGRDVPFGGIQLAMFELIKAYILNNPNIDFDSSTLTAEAIIGAFAGGFGAFVTNPMDILTTRIITQDIGSDDEPLGVVGMGRKVYEEEGVAAFFTGWQARVGYWAPAISIFLTCYCSVRQAGIKYDWFP